MGSRRRRALGLAAGFCGVAVVAACSSDAPTPLHGGSSGSSSGAPADGGGSSGGTSGGTSGTAGDTDAAGPPDAGTPDGGPGSSPSNGAAKPNCKYTAHATGLRAFQQTGGLAFHVYAPTSYDPNVGHRVIVLMHGQDSDGTAELTSLWQGIADSEQLVVVAPRGSRPATNGDPNAGNWATDDLNHILDLIPEIDDCYDVFTLQHILWGFSEGCFYGYLLGLGSTNTFSGLAMGGANTSFARESGYAPANETWKIPVSDVHGTQDPNPIALTLQDQADFEAAGSVFTLHQHDGGHSITPDQVRLQYDDLKLSLSPAP